MKYATATLCTILKLLLICSLIQRTNSKITDTISCTVCRDGSSTPSNFSNVAIVLPGYEQFVRNCGDLENIASTLTSGASICTNIQSIGTLCGCPIPENACTLCQDGSSIPEEYYGTSLIHSSDNPLLPPNCGLLQAFLHSATYDNATCSDGLQFAKTCGCSETKDLSLPSSSPQLSPTTSASEICTLCRNGGQVAYPEKDITPFIVRNADILTKGFSNFLIPPNPLATFTCQNLASLLGSTSLFNNGTEQCHQLQFSLGGICGCQPLERYCTFCPNDEHIPQANKPLDYMKTYREGTSPLFTCSELRLLLTQVGFNSNQCFLLNQMQHTCGCNGGERYYMGTDSILQKAFLAWIPRVTGLLSLMGSLWIIIDVMRNSVNRNLIFSQLMLGISTFDCFSSVAWIFSSAPVPKYYYGQPTGVYGAIGNDATCKAQGFFVELGLIGSVSFNFVLSIYYVLVIVKSYREFQFQRLRRWFLVLPIILACTFAFSGLPHYSYLILSCHIAPYPVNTNQAPVLGFAMIPLGVAWCVCSFNMGWIYWSVRKQSKAARKWRFPTRGSSVTTKGNASESYSQQGNNRDNATSITSNFSLNCLCKPRWFRCRNVEANGISASTQQNESGTSENAQNHSRAPMQRAVAWQASFYLCSFLLTWPFYFASFLCISSESYMFWVMVVVATPLQGFFNWIVYMRPRWGQEINKWKQRRHLQGSGKSSKGTRPASHSTNQSSMPSLRDVAVKENSDSVDGPTKHDNESEEGNDFVVDGKGTVDQKGVISDQNRDSSCEP